jgi:DegV family protein with EDD domain
MKMGTICVVTDSTAQFPSPHFPGKQLIHILPIEINFHGTIYKESDIKVKSLPPSIDHTSRSIVVPPSPESIRKYLVDLSRTYEEIICIFTSSNLHPGIKNAHAAIKSIGETLRIQLIDSQCLSIGLGFLVQSAVESLEAGATSSDVERIVCSLIPHIYSILCIPGLTYLQHNNQLDQAQGIIGELLDLMPFFSIEEGRLTPLDKMRNLRQTVEFYQEFLAEFDMLEHIGLLQSSPPQSQLTRMLRDTIRNNHTDTPFTEHRINPALAAILGPRTMGMIAIESPSDSPI